jgi:RNA polymerase sigma factor (sigma-70 family)
MAISPMTEVLQHLRRAVLRDGAGLTDGQLLEDFLSRRDEVALAALVGRHSPMVWGVCRRVLRNCNDAEDAFQATFLVLVRKAASIVPRQMVGNWLHGVAYRTALRARAMAATRKQREKQVATMPEPAVTPKDPWQDLQPLLDQELSRLPHKYRTVIVLCDLEGKTRKAAAEQLGVPPGTVAGRLARARALLAKRLARDGPVASGSALAALLSQNAALACMPASLVSSTVTAASLFAAGAAISTRVAALAEGALKAMLLAKIKIATVVLLAVALTGALGIGMVPPTAVAVEQTQALKTQQRQAEPAEAARQHRILRWKIVFNTKDGKDYAKQLEALGATLAIPTERDHRYRVICNLSKRPVEPTVEDLAGMDRLFWVETNARSIRLLSDELGLQQAPRQIVVFLPKFVEDELLRKESAYAERAEQDIAETIFEFYRSRKGFDIKVTSQR